MNTINVTFQDLIIEDVPVDEYMKISFATQLNISIIKSEMKRLKINKCNYEDYCKKYK